MRRLTTAAAIVVSGALCLACNAPPPRAGTEADARTKRRAMAEAEAEAKNKANREAYTAEVQRLKAQHQGSVEKFKADKANYAKIMVAYDKAKAEYDATKAEYDAAKKLFKAEYDAAKKLASARPPAGASQGLKDVYHRKQREIIKLYPETQAAKDAKILLTDGYVAARKLPTQPIEPTEPVRPVLPVEPYALQLPPPPEAVAVIYPPEPEQASATMATAEAPGAQNTGQPVGGTNVGNTVHSGGGANHGKTEHVSGYTTKNGTHVAPYTRGAPGTGRHK